MKNLKLATPQMGDMIDASGMTEDQCNAIVGCFIKHMPETSAYTTLLPSEEHGAWYCWTENNSVELGAHFEHVECLMDYDLEMRVLTFDFNSCEFFASPNPNSTTASTRTAYADNINYYKRMIQQGTCAINHLTEKEAYQKLGYWEGRYDELTTGGRE